MSTLPHSATLCHTLPITATLCHYAPEVDSSPGEEGPGGHEHVAAVSFADAPFDAACSRADAQPSRSRATSAAFVAATEPRRVHSASKS